MEVKSIKELIEMKTKIEDQKNQICEIEIPSLNTKFKFKKATRAEIVNIRNMEPIEQDQYLIFNNVVEPNLKDPELQEAFNFGCPPHFIVDKMLSIAEVGKLSLAIIGENENPNFGKDIKHL